MKRALFSLFACLGLVLIGLSAQAQFIVQVANFTFSAGDPIYPITNDVTFTDLVLTEKFADNTSSSLVLFDSTHTAATSLDTGTLFLETDPLALGSAAHGAVTNFSLSGMFDLTNLDIATSFGGPTTNVDVAPTFTATLPLPTVPGFVNIDAVDVSSGAHYGAGTLALTNGVSVVPEPGAWVFALTLGGGLASHGVRRRIRS